MSTCALALAALAVLAGCDPDPPPSSEPLPDNLFQRQMERPAWLGDTDAPRLTSADEVSALWRSKKRCCVSERKLTANNREFYKACHVAIGEHFDDDELVVKCLWLMDAGAEGDQRRQIKRFLVEHYFDHRSRTDNCANCAPADVVARVSGELAMLELRGGRDDEAARLVEDVLDRRLPEISPWVQVELYTKLARIYLAAQMDDARRARLAAAYERLSKLAAGDDAVSRRLEAFETVYREAAER